MFLLLFNKKSIETIQPNLTHQRAVVVAQFGRVVVSDARGPWFESSHQLNICLLSTVLKKRKIK